MRLDSNAHRSPRRPPRSIGALARATHRLGFALVGSMLAAGVALAALPDAKTLLKGIGLLPGEIQQIESGSLVRHSIKPSSDRELTTGIAFKLPVPTPKLVADSKRNLFGEVDPNMIAHGTFSNPATVADLAKLDLPLDQVRAYASAEPGGDLNLSDAEIATFQKLGKDASKATLQKAVNEALVARVEAYRAKGIAALAPYAFARGKQRSPGEELRNATKAATGMKKFAPEAYQLMLDYPKDKPKGMEEQFRWSYFKAHDVPTIALSHVMLIPDGDAWILVKRQYYVSAGYNAVQETGAFLPVQDGTIVIYANHTSTDQVTGFGGSAKRSIGSKLLASQIEALFEKASKAAEGK